MSEFACYSFDTVSEFNQARLSILYNEALRQRAAKASLLSALVNKPNQEKSEQEKINDVVNSMLNPYRSHFVDVVAEGWDGLRSRSKGL